MKINPEEFQKSITKELDIIRNKVRDLIGNANWGEEGRYKEAVLKNVLRKFLPPNLSIGTGFIIKGDDFLEKELSVSTQIDIIIYDSTYPVLFYEGDFIITTESHVKGIIEVKSKIRNAKGQMGGLNNIIKKSASFFSSDPTHQHINQDIFNGIFSFDYDDNIDSENVDEALKVANGKVNHICLGKDIFIKYWNNSVGLIDPVDCANDFYNIYKLKDMSFSYFISNLVQTCTGRRMHDRQWFLYPITGTKEKNRIRTVCLEKKKKKSYRKSNQNISNI